MSALASLNEGADFTENAINITVPANSREYNIDAFFNITADNVDEDEQSFAVVAKIGQDVPANVSCFQIVDGQTGCTTERRGATRIRISDIDRKMMVKGLLIVIILSCSYDNWVHYQKYNCKRRCFSWV